MSDDSGDDGASESPTPDASYFKRKKMAQQRKIQARKPGNEEEDPESLEDEGEDVDPIEVGFAAAQEVAADMSADAASGQWDWQHASLVFEGAALEDSHEAQQLADQEALIAAEFERITAKRQQAALAARDKSLGDADASAVISPTTVAGGSPISDAQTSFMRDDLKRDRKTPPRVLRASPGASLSLTSPLSPDRPVPSVPSSLLLEPRVNLAYSPPSSSNHLAGSSGSHLESPSFELGQRQPARPTAVQAAREAYSPRVERISDDSSLGSVEEVLSSDSSSSPPPLPAEVLSAVAPEAKPAPSGRDCGSPTLASLKANSLVARAKASLGNASTRALPPSLGTEDSGSSMAPSATTTRPPVRQRWNQSAPQQTATSSMPKAPPASYFVNLSEDGLHQQQPSLPQVSPQGDAAATQATNRSPSVSNSNAAAVRAIDGTDASSVSPVRSHRSMFDLMRSSPSNSLKGAAVASGASATDFDDTPADLFLDSMRTDEPSMVGDFEGIGHKNTNPATSQPSVRERSALFERGRPKHKGKSDRVPSQRSKSAQFARRQPKQLQSQQQEHPLSGQSSSPGANFNQPQNNNNNNRLVGPTSPRSPPPQPVGTLNEPRSSSSPRRAGSLPPAVKPPRSWPPPANAATPSTAAAAGSSRATSPPHVRGATSSSPSSTPPRPYRPTNSADFIPPGGSSTRSPRATAQENLRKLTPSTKARISYSDAFVSRVPPGSTLTPRHMQQEEEHRDVHTGAASPESDANAEADAVEIGRQADVLWASLQKSVQGPPGGHATLGGYQFRDLDRDGNGRLSLEEFGDAMVEAGLVSGVDWHLSSSSSLSNSGQGHSIADGGPYDGTAAHGLVSGAVLSCVFAAADNDNDGTMDYLEFMHTLRQWGVFPSEVAARRRAQNANTTAQVKAKKASTIPRKDPESSLNSSRNVSFDLVNITSASSSNTPIRHRSASSVGPTRGRTLHKPAQQQQQQQHQQQPPPQQQQQPQQSPRRPLPGQKFRRPAPSRALEKGPLWQQVEVREAALRAASEAEAAARAQSRANSPLPTAKDSGAALDDNDGATRESKEGAADFSASGSFLRDNLPSLRRPSALAPGQQAAKLKLKLPPGAAGRRARERTAAKVYDATGELVVLRDDDEANEHSDGNGLDNHDGGETPSLFENSSFGFGLDNDASNLSSSSLAFDPQHRRRSTSARNDDNSGGGGSGGSKGGLKRRAASQADMEALRRHLQAGLELHTFTSPSKEQRDRAAAAEKVDQQEEQQRRSESDLLHYSHEPNDSNMNLEHDVAPTRPAPSRPKQPNPRSAFPLFGSSNDKNNYSTKPRTSSESHRHPARTSTWQRPSARSSSRSRPPPAFARAAATSASATDRDHRGASEPRPFNASVDSIVGPPPLASTSRPALRNTVGRYQQPSPPPLPSNEPLAASSAHHSLHESDPAKAPYKRSQSTPPLLPTPPPLDTNTSATAHAPPLLAPSTESSSSLPVDARSGFGHYQNELAATRAAVANRRAGIAEAKIVFSGTPSEAPAAAAATQKGNGLTRGRFVPIGTASADDVAGPPSLVRPQFHSTFHGQDQYRGGGVSSGNNVRRPRSADPIGGIGRWGPTPPPVLEGNSDEDDDSTSSQGKNSDEAAHHGAAATAAIRPAPRRRQRFEEDEDGAGQESNQNYSDEPSSAEVLALRAEVARLQQLQAAAEDEASRQRAEMSELRQSVADLRASATDFSGSGLRASGGGGGFSSSGNWARASADSSRASSLWATSHGVGAHGSGSGGVGGAHGGRSGGGDNNVPSGSGGVGSGDEFRDTWGGDREDFRATVMDFLNATLRTQRMSTPPPPPQSQEPHKPPQQQQQQQPYRSGSPVDGAFNSNEADRPVPVAEVAPAAAADTADADTTTKSAVASLAAQMASQAEEAQRAHNEELRELKASLASLRADVARFSVADGNSTNIAAAVKKSPTKGANTSTSSSTRHEAKAEQAAIERARAAENALAKAEQKVRLHGNSPIGGDVGRAPAQVNEEASADSVSTAAVKERAAREAAEAKATEAMAALEALRKEVADERAKRGVMAAKQHQAAAEAKEEQDRLRAEEHAKAVNAAAAAATAIAKEEQEEQLRKVQEEEQQRRRTHEAQQKAIRRREEEEADRLAQLEVERRAQQEVQRKAEQKALRKAQREKAEQEAQREAQRQAEIEARRRENAEETNKSRAARLAREQSAAREVAALKQLRAEAQATGQDLQRLRADAETQARDEAAQRAQVAAQVAAEREQHQREAAAAAAALSQLQDEALEASREASLLAEAEQAKCRSAVAEAAAAAEELAAFKASAAAAASEAIAAAEREAAAMAATHSEALKAARAEAALAAQRSVQERKARAADQLALKEARAEVAAAKAAAAQAAATESTAAATRAAVSVQEAEQQRAVNDDLERRRLLEEAFASTSRRRAASSRKQSMTHDDVATAAATASATATAARSKPAYQPRASWDSVMFNKPNRNGLPPGWVEVKDPTTGKIYFIHRDTRETTWKRPEWPDSTPVASVETSPNRGGKASPVLRAPLSAQKLASEDEEVVPSDEPALEEDEAAAVLAENAPEPEEPGLAKKANAPMSSSSTVPIEASTTPHLDASPHLDPNLQQQAPADNADSAPTVKNRVAIDLPSAPLSPPQTPSNSDNAQAHTPLTKPTQTAPSAMQVENNTTTANTTNAAATNAALAAAGSQQNDAEASAEEVWMKLARLAATDKKGFLARFTQLDPSATGYLSSQLFGQVIEDAMLRASLLDQADEHEEIATAAIKATPEVCALLMRTADPPGFKLLQQQAAHQAQQQQQQQQRQQSEKESRTHAGMSLQMPHSSSSSSDDLALPSNIEYRKFVHAVNARSRSGMSTADWIAGQHAKAAHSSVLSPTKWGCAVCAKRNDEEHSACVGCGAERGRAVGNYMSAVKKAKDANPHYHQQVAAAGAGTVITSEAGNRRLGEHQQSSAASSSASMTSDGSPPSGNSPHNGAVSAPPLPPQPPAERALFLDEASGLLEAPSFQRQGMEDQSVSDLTVTDASMLLGPAPIKDSNSSSSSNGGSNAATENTSRACNSYAVDVLAPSFGQCKCGHFKSAHGVHAFSATASAQAPLEAQTPLAASAAAQVDGDNDQNRDGTDVVESQPVDDTENEEEAELQEELGEEDVTITFRASFGEGPIGMSFNQYEGGRWNLVVTRVEPGGAATLAGVSPGDLIAEVNGELLSAQVNEDDLFDMLVELPRPIEIGFLRLDELPDWELALEMSHHQYDDDEDDDDENGDDAETSEGEDSQHGAGSENDAGAAGKDRLTPGPGSGEDHEEEELEGELPEAPSASATVGGATFHSPKSANEAAPNKVLPSVLRATPKSILRAHRSMANPQHGGNYAADSRDIGSMTGLMRSTQSPDQLSGVG